jgi:hypothetical protein
MDVFVDGSLVGQSLGFTNEFDSHKTFVTQFIRVPPGTGFLPAGSHTIQLVAKTQNNCGTSDTVTDFCTTTDGSDFFDVGLIEIPR